MLRSTRNLGQVEGRRTGLPAPGAFVGKLRYSFEPAGYSPARLDNSSLMPGPMVELSETFLI